MSNLRRNASGLSSIEKFAFSLLRSAACHSVAMPIHRYGTILQLKNTMIEEGYNDYDISSWIDLIIDKNTMMAIYYRTCLLLTSHGTAQIFKERIKRKINVQRTDKRYIRIIKRVMFSTMTRVITFSFGHYFSYKQSLYFINKTEEDISRRKWRFGFTQKGFKMLCITTIIDQLLWYSSYYWFAPYLNKPIHSKIRTYASNFIIHPLYTIMRRQMITNENIYDAVISLINNYGFISLFDGAFYEILRSMIYDLSGKTFDYLLKQYVLWRYDVYGIQNTLNLCKEYVEIVEKSSVLTNGYIRQFIERENECIYIPKQLIDLISNTFYREEECLILDGKLNKFCYKLSKIKLNKQKLNEFLYDEKLQKNVKNLFENKKFQKLWKNKIYDEMQRKQEMENKENKNIVLSSTINNRYNCYYFGCKNIIFYCDLCLNAMESKRICRFKKCGHCFCTQCRRNFRIKRKCGICQQKWTRNKNYYYLIPKIP